MFGTRSRPKKKKQVQYTRPVSLLRLIMWQVNAVLVAVLLNGAMMVYHHKVSIKDIDKHGRSLLTLIEICSEISWKDCRKVHAIVKRRSDK